MLKTLGKFPSPVIYGISVAIEKSFALITIPLMAVYLSPSEYGKFDVAVTLTEFVTLIAGFGLAEQLIRFVSTAENDAEAKKCAGELLGCAVSGAIVSCLVVVALSSSITQALGITLDLNALRILLVAACLSNLIGIPLGWLRLQDDAVTFLVLVVARTVLQVLGLWFALSSGFGAEGALIANGCVLICFALLLTVIQHRKTAIAFAGTRFVQIASYGLPIVGAMLAMFALGSANRLFLSLHVGSETIGYVGLAARFAMATSLLIYPLELWWLPKRIAVLRAPDGLIRSARVWGAGIAVLLISGVVVSLAVPVFVVVALPASYAGALAFLPFLVVTQIMHDTAGLTETGSYARETGYRVLLIDTIGAAVAIAGFALLIPIYGAYGAIAAVFAGQCCRIFGYIRDGAELAPIPYPWGAASITAAAAVAAIYFAPAPDQIAARAGWLLVAALGLGGISVISGLVQLPPDFNARVAGLIGKGR